MNHRTAPSVRSLYFNRGRTISRIAISNRVHSDSPRTLKRKTADFGSKEAASKGGKARAEKLTQEELSAQGKAAVEKRWEKAGKRPPIGSKSITVKHLPPKPGGPPIGHQGQLFVTRELEIDGVGMGVLSDGTAFLTGRGLARLCGVSNARIVELGQVWDVASTNAMAEGVKRILQAKGITAEKPYVEIAQRGGVFYAYPDFVCLAVLEYYAFDQPTDDAKKNFRILAGKALHDFIYAQVGYDPSNLVPEKWRQFTHPQAQAIQGEGTCTQGRMMGHDEKLCLQFLNVRDILTQSATDYSRSEPRLRQGVSKWQML